MAKKKSTQPKKSQAPRASNSSSSVNTNSFIKGMNKDVTPSFEQNDSWYHAINVANNSSDGDVGVIGNEPANLQCGVIPYTVIGAIHRYGDEWIVYSTDDISSEIGRFNDSECKYEVIVNDPCLNFSKKHLITGAAKENFDCTWQVYWDDGNNPSRSMNIDDIPWVQAVTSATGDPCITFQDTPFLDCEKIRLHPLVDTPCVQLTKATDGGTIKNGAYQAYIAYTENSQVISDYIGISNIQTIWSHEGSNGSLDIQIDGLDKDYFYFDLILLIRQQGQIYTKKIGNYSTETKYINIDYIDQSLPSISFEELFRQSPSYEKSDSMYVLNDYLIRQGPTEQFDFNYQPLANNINVNWVINEVSEQYYINSGNKIGFMRDEQYAFFIRWIYNTGERSFSYHIPGRAPTNYTLPNGATVNETDDIFGVNTIDPAGDPVYKVYNTASVDALVTEIQPDGSTIIARGKMGYWESTEKYPDKKPEIWGDLCGKPIRHHKMPNEMINPVLGLTDGVDTGIRILGVEFTNIERPKYNDGTYIPNIVGYEILRGSRLGNKSILAKGMFKNMRKYNLPSEDNLLGNAQGLYPNYPYNDLRPDVFHTTVRKTSGCPNNGPFTNSEFGDYPPLSGFTDDVFTFHSPELMFTQPFLNAYESVFYGQISGESNGYFKPSENHPQFKLLRNISAILGGLVGIGYAIRNLNGTPQTTALPVQGINNAYPEWQIAERGGGGGTWNDFASSTTLGGVATASTRGNISDHSGGDGNNNYKGGGAYTDAHEAIQEYVNRAGGGSGSSPGGFNLNDFLDKAQELLTGGAEDIQAAAGLDKSTQQRLQELAIENVEETAISENGGLMGGGNQEAVTLDTSESNLSAIFKGAMSLILMQKNIAIGGQEIIDLIYNLVSFQEHVLKYNSHGFYNDFTAASLNDLFRVKNEASNYIGSSFQTFDDNKYKINNLFRPSTVAISTADPIPTNYGVEDKSRFALGGYATSTGAVVSTNDTQNLLNPEGPFSGPISALYGALKFNIDNQYGQLDGIKQIPMKGCVEILDPTLPNEYKYTSRPIFGGDVFIARYTEKCIMPIFTDFLIGQYDGFPYDYYLRYNVPYPRFWINSRKFDMAGMAATVSSLGLNQIFGVGDLSGATVPNEMYYLDRGDTCGFQLLGLMGNSLNSAFAMNHAYMYSHINGINDFYVETEINLPYRDYEEPKERRFYDTYTYNDLNDLFHAEIQKYDNFYKYDESLSPSKFVTQNTSFAQLQDKDYDPLVSETCYTYYPKRLIYSLQANEEDKRDYWRQYLFANYKDFKDRVSVIKSFDKTGAIMFFPYQSPQILQGVDTLRTDANTKITIGDGGLFNQKLQNIVNSDLSNEYGSLESQRGVINTPAGLFYISQAQGKIFQFSPGRGLDPISNMGMKWWFNKYLPSRFIKQFPLSEGTEWADNPVVGVGCQVIYDPNDDIVYFMKKDYSIKPEWVSKATFNDAMVKPISIDTGLPTKLRVDIGDPLYFNDCSWTISYDPKAKAWISFHDWHPEFALPSINHFFTTKTIESSVPICPPGYSFNSTTGLCEIIQNTQQPADITVDEVAASVTGGPEACLIDLVITIDSSGSTNQSCNGNAPSYIPMQFDATGQLIAGTGVVGNTCRSSAELRWLDVFLNNPLIDTALNNGTMQIGFAKWAANSVQYFVNNTSLYTGTAGGGTWNNGIDRVAIVNWYQNNWGNSGNTTNANAAIGTATPTTGNGGLALLNDKVHSQLAANYPARSQSATFRQVLICITDGNGGTQPNPAVTAFQTTLAGNGNTGAWANTNLGDPNKQEIWGGFVGNGDNGVPNNPALLNSISGTNYSQPGVPSAPYQFTTDALNNASLDPTANAIAGAVCSTPYVCECPTGYELVYLGSNGFYDAPTGTCDDITPPICRQVSCSCPPPIPGFTSTLLGTCPDTLPELAYIGDPNWIDPTPPICDIYYRDTVQASYKTGSFWRHNVRCDLFANYYGKDYPWEVELISNTGQAVNTIRSVEYQLETYVYKGEPEYNMCGGDKWEDLSFNFDTAIIYNNEQVSGLLNIVSQPYNNPWGELQYPITNVNSTTILASKVEHKFRFNQFSDITNDRGEFSNAEQSVFDTQCNGYIRPLNSTNLNYYKPAMQRKKFRHYSNHVLLRRQQSGNRKMLLRLENTKLLLSMR